MTDLEDQTGKLQNINRNVVDISEELHHSGSIMRRILRRENRNKLLLGLFGIMILIIFIIILFVKLA